MVSRINFRTATVAPLVVASALIAGCSSDDSGSAPSYTPFDSGSVVTPEAGAAPESAVTIQIQGQGNVYSADAHEVEGGLVGAMVCTPSSAASACTAAQPSTVYAIPSAGWVVSGWTTSS